MGHVEPNLSHESSTMRTDHSATPIEQAGDLAVNTPGSDLSPLGKRPVAEIDTTYLGATLDEDRLEAVDESRERRLDHREGERTTGSSTATSTRTPARSTKAPWWLVVPSKQLAAKAMTAAMRTEPAMRWPQKKLAPLEAGLEN